MNGFMVIGYSRGTKTNTAFCKTKEEAERIAREWKHNYFMEGLNDYFVEIIFC